VKTFDELVEGIKEIKDCGFVKTHRADDTGIGKTLEDLLGIKENNFSGPDGQDTELKAARINSSSMLTLFTKSPLPRAINSKLRKAYGYPDKTYAPKLCLHSTVTSTRFNSDGFRIIGKKDRIELACNKKQTKIPDMPIPYWKKETLEEAIKDKYKDSLLYAKAEFRGNGKEEEFHFIEAYHLQGLNFEKFSTNLSKGILKVDIRLGFNGPDTKKPGTPHDHGTGFRINPSFLDLIFAKTKRVV
tara:strand:+ start:85 stop:816 length:732 start_codon:yes stop_codon:yes gene_type:complete